MNPMERIAELIAKLTECSAEELAELDGLIDGQMAEYEKAEAITPDLIAEMDTVVQAAEACKAESARRGEEVAAAQQKAEELRSRFKVVRAEGGDEGEGDEAGEGEGEEGEVVAPPVDVETPAAEEGAETPAAVAASANRGRAAAMAGRSGRPVTPANGEMVAIVASGAGRGSQVGEVLDLDRLSHVISDTLRSMPRTGAPRGPVIIASADWRDRFPEERRLDDNAIQNGVKLSRIMGAANPREAVIASGGICSPVNIDWSVETWAVADTPLNDGLSSFQADRGGLTWNPPPDIAALAGATEVWTEAMDAGAPGNGLTKPVLSIACPSPTTVYVDAVPTRIGFGNMEGRFAPEWIAANTELSVAAASRIRELNTLSHIDAASSLVNSYALLGTARDLLATVDQAVAYFRDVHRLSDGQGLTAIFPRWAKNAFRADIARELAHDEDDSAPLAVPDEMIDAYFKARGVTVIWMLDGRAAKTSGGSTLQYPVQTYTKVTTNNPIPPWINKTVWNLFTDGTFQRLDSGILDIGVVRDSTLDATNDYELFTEVFESVAFRGNEALTIISPVLPNGASAGTQDTSSYTGA